MKRLRVVLCGEFPTTAGAIHGGGVQAVTHTLARALAERDDLEVHVATAVRRPPAGDAVWGRLAIHYVPRLPLPRLATGPVHDVPRLVRLLRRLRPDVIHGQGQTQHGLAAVRCGLPHVVTPHGVLFIESPLLGRGLAGRIKSSLIDRMEREVFARAREMILISRYLPSVYGTMLRARVHFIENPIDEAFFTLERRAEPGRLLFVGTIVARKRVPLLVEALAAARGACPGARLCLAGPLAEPEAVREVREAIRRHGLEEAVEMTGAVPQERILAEYARASVLLLSSREETSPQAIAQALACGLPVAAVAAAGVPHMVEHERTALLVPHPDARALGEAAARLLAGGALAQRLSEEGRREARERFDAASVARRTAEVYRLVAGASSR